MIRALLAHWLLIGLLLLPVTEAFSDVPVEAFARMPTFTDMEISPGGRYVAARLFREDRYVLSIFEVQETGVKYVYGFNENDTVSISWFEWVSGDRLLASAAFTGVRGVRKPVPTQERRLLVINAATTEVTPVFRNKKDKLAVQYQDRIVSFLPNEPDNVLIQYSKSDSKGPGVYRVDLREPRKHIRVQRGRSGVSRWMADADGDVRLGEGLVNDEPFLIVREKGSDRWQEFSHRVGVDGVTFDPVGFSKAAATIYVRSNHEGDPLGLYTFDISTDEFGPLIFKHDSVDVAAVKLDEKTGELLHVSFVEDDVAMKRFSERPIREQIRKFHEQHPGHRLATRSISTDGQHAVLRIHKNRDAGNYVLLNGVENRAITLPPQYPDLANVTLGQSFATEYVARDGLVIPAFVTLPAPYESLQDAKNIPFVIHPHGGPGSRDFMGFHFDVQFFVSRGYGVLQMNFRGSTGYGQAFKDAGSRQWGQAMQDDITDGANWLIENQLADAGRVAIVGGSYGGYVALMGAVKTPDLYQCAISFAGVTDLPDLLARAQRFTGGKYATRFVGDLWKDRKMLAEFSPARRADEIEIPILLIHGDEDTVVEISQSEKMAKQLRKHGKDYEFVVLEKGNHHHSLYQNRLRYLQAMDAFLDKCLQ